MEQFRLLFGEDSKAFRYIMRRTENPIYSEREIYIKTFTSAFKDELDSAYKPEWIANEFNWMGCDTIVKILSFETSRVDLD